MAIDDAIKTLLDAGGETFLEHVRCWGAVHADPRSCGGKGANKKKDPTKVSKGFGEGMKEWRGKGVDANSGPVTLLLHVAVHNISGSKR